MKKLPLFLAASLFAGTAGYSSPLLSIGEHADLYATVDGSVAYTDNLTLDESNELDDFRFIVTPGLSLELGRGLTNLNGRLAVNYGFVRYADNTVFDTELWNITGVLDFSGPRYTADVSGGYVERQQNQSDVNADQILILQKTGFAGGNLKYSISEKISAGVGGRFDNISYDGGSNVDRNIYSVPVNVYYELTPKLDGTAGFRYRQTDVQDTIDYDDYFFNVGLDGALTEKLSTNARIGYQIRELSDGGSDEGTISLISTTLFDVSERGLLRVVLNRDFVTGGEGSSIEQTGILASYQHQVTPLLAGSVTGAYDLNDYQQSSREDNTYYARVGASYQFSAMWEANAAYTFRDNDSNLSGASYTENLVSVGASFRY